MNESNSLTTAIKEMSLLYSGETNWAVYEYVLEIQVYWQGMIRLGLMGQIIYDYQLKQQLDLLFNYLA